MAVKDTIVTALSYIAKPGQTWKQFVADPLEVRLLHQQFLNNNDHLIMSLLHATLFYYHNNRKLDKKTKRERKKSVALWKNPWRNTKGQNQGFMLQRIV